MLTHAYCLATEENGSLVDAKEDCRGFGLPMFETVEGCPAVSVVCGIPCERRWIRFPVQDVIHRHSRDS
jgi:hypothetical protein